MNVTAGMLQAAPKVAQFQEAVARGDRFDLGIGPEVTDAAAVLDELSRTGTPVSNWLAQGTLFDRIPAVTKLVEILSENKRSSRRIGDVLKEYNDVADAVGSPKQESMFGPAEPPSKSDLLEAAYDRARANWKEKKPARDDGAVQQARAAVEPSDGSEAPRDNAPARPGEGPASAAGQPATPEVEASPKPSPYPANHAEAMARLDQNEIENRAKGIHPDTYAGKSGARRAAAQDRHMAAQAGPEPAVPSPPASNQVRLGDPVEMQKLRGSIAEGEMLLRHGKKTDGAKFSPAERGAIQRSVSSSKAKLIQHLEAAGGEASVKSRNPLQQAVQRNKAEIAANKAKLQPAPEVGPHGPILRQFHHDAQGALAHLLREGTGDAIGALHHSGVGDFDLTADIAAKLRDRHPEVIGDLQGFISKLKKESESANRIILASGDRQQRAAVRLDYDGAAKRWLLTAYDRDAQRPTGETTDASRTLNQGEGTVAPSGRPRVPLSPEGNSGAPATSMSAEPKAVNSTEGQSSFVTPTEELKSKAQQAANEAKLTHDQLTAQLKSGGAVKPSRLKPAENRGLFDEEKPESGDLFGNERGSLSLKSTKTPEQIQAERDKQYGQNMREWFTARRDLWSARVRQNMELLRKKLPETVDREGLLLMRDMRNHPGELAQYLAGTHPVFGEVPRLDLANENIQKLRPAIERAMNPTPEMLKADSVLTHIAEISLREGQRLGFIDHHVSPDEYVTHLFDPEDKQKPGLADLMGKAMGGKIGRNFPFNQERAFPTILEAIANGQRPKTLDALRAFDVYGDKFATARATHMLINQLRDSDTGVWGSQAGGGRAERLGRDSPTCSPIPQPGGVYPTQRGNRNSRAGGRPPDAIRTAQDRGGAEANHRPRLREQDCRLLRAAHHAVVHQGRTARIELLPRRHGKLHGAFQYGSAWLAEGAEGGSGRSRALGARGRLYRARWNDRDTGQNIRSVRRANPWLTADRGRGMALKGGDSPCRERGEGYH